MVWKMLYAGRWALLDKWLSFCSKPNLPEKKRKSSGERKRKRRRKNVLVFFLFAERLMSLFSSIFSASTNMKSVSRDTWQQLHEFIEQHPKDVSNHDPDSSWPVAIDEFVVWMQKNA
jgi:hypothetical protein